MTVSTLNKDSFNNMAIPEQIQIINKFITLGESVSNIAKQLEYNEATLRDRYKKAGYDRVSKRGIFVLVSELEAKRAEAKEKREAKIKQDYNKKQINKGANKMTNTSKPVTKTTEAKQIQGQENLLNTVERGDNLYKLLPSKEGKYSKALELNNAVKKNINIKTNKELSRKILSINNFLTAMEPEAEDAIGYTSIIIGAISMYFDKLQAEYGEDFNKYVINTATEPVTNNHHKAIAELIQLVNGESK